MPEIAFDTNDKKEDDLKELIERLESGADDDNKSGNARDNHRSPNVILMKVQVETERGDSRPFYIGGYASHQWKANN